MRAEGAGGPSERVSERGTRRATNGWPPDEVFGRRKRDTQEDGAGGREGRREDPLPSRPANPSSDVNREYELAEKVSYASEQGKWRARLTGMNPFQSAARGCYGLDSRKREILSPARWQKERERGRNREGGRGHLALHLESDSGRRRGIREGKEGGAKRQRSWMVRHGRQDHLEGFMMKE